MTIQSQKQYRTSYAITINLLTQIDYMGIAAVPYESIDDGSISSITQQPKLSKFTNVSKDNEYENRCDSDGKIGPFFEAVVDKDAMDDS